MRENRIIYIFLLWVSYVLLSKRLSRHQVPRGELLLCLVQALAVAVLMGRASYVFFEGQKVSLEALLVSPPSWYGGLLGTIIILWYWSKRWNHLSAWLIMDKFLLYCPAVYAFFRISCFFEGHCIGLPTELPWSISYSNNPARLIHPVQLYDSYLNFCLFIALAQLEQRKTFDGQITLLFLILHSSIRFFTEYFRWGVSAVVVGGVITQAQIASLVIIAGPLIAWQALSRRTVVSGQLSVAS